MSVTHLLHTKSHTTSSFHKFHTNSSLIHKCNNATIYWFPILYSCIEPNINLGLCSVSITVIGLLSTNDGLFNYWLIVLHGQTIWKSLSPSTPFATAQVLTLMVTRLFYQLINLTRKQSSCHWCKITLLCSGMKYCNSLINIAQTHTDLESTCFKTSSTSILSQVCIIQ